MRAGVELEDRVGPGVFDRVDERRKTGSRSLLPFRRLDDLHILWTNPENHWLSHESSERRF